MSCANNNCPISADALEIKHIVLGTASMPSLLFRVKKLEDKIDRMTQQIDRFVRLSYIGYGIFIAANIYLEIKSKL
jgi:hypothetical protein